MNIKDFIVDTLGNFDTDFDPHQEASYYQEMLFEDYAKIVETILESDAPEAADAGLPEGPWTRPQMLECMARVLRMSDAFIGTLQFDLFHKEG